MSNEVASLLAQVKEIVQRNEVEMNKVEGDQSQAQNLHTFAFEGIEVWDAFSDTSMRFEVNPIEYYGKAIIEKFVQSAPSF